MSNPQPILKLDSPHWPPEPTWENVERLVGDALQWWDRWCPDDGRPAAALDALKRYQTESTTTAYTALRHAAYGLHCSVQMAAAAMAEPPMLASPAVAAYYAVMALRWAIVVNPPQDVRDTRWRKAIDSAGIANLTGFMAYPDDDDEPEELQEAVGE